MEVAAQEKLPYWREGGLTELYVGGVHFYQNSATSENRTLGQVVLFQFRALQKGASARGESSDLANCCAGHFPSRTRWSI